ncbi:MAG: tyrosine-type recombinase/integrase [Opitutaceae bacterium]
MKPNSSFVISQFTNPSGDVVFRVSGSLDGKRIRKNFPTRADAEAERQALDIGDLQSKAGVRPAITRLTDEQLHEAEAVFQRLVGRPQPLSFYVDFALTNYREPEKQKPLAEAVTEYVAAKEHEFAQGQLSTDQLKRIRCDLRRLKNHFGSVTVAELTAPNLLAYLELGQPGLKTYNNRRGIVSTFLKFAFHRGWVTENPIAKVPHHRIRRKRGSALTLSAAQAAAFMEKMESFEGGRWVPYFALCLFAGIRPSVPGGEITRLKPEDIDLERGEISISAEVSKVREPRRVKIHPNLATWLRAYPLSKFRIVVPNGQQRRSRIAQEHGLTHDVLRHSFISFFVAKYRSIGEAAIQAGNSESIIRRHYLDLKSTEEADQFFGILPKHAEQTAALRTVAFPARTARALRVAV